MTPRERTETKKCVCCKFNSVIIRVTFSVNKYTNCIIILSAMVRSGLIMILQFTELEK